MWSSIRLRPRFRTSRAGLVGSLGLPGAWGLLGWGLDWPIAGMCLRCGLVRHCFRVIAFLLTGTVAGSDKTGPSRHGRPGGRRVGRPGLLRGLQRFTPYGKETRRKQFQPHSGRGGPVHAGQGLIDTVGHRSQGGQSQGIRLAVQVCDLIGIGVLAQHTLGLVAGQLQHQEVADMG